ncbi:MAG TPA: WD40 repeat domain-containing serine/threonine protein kinase, partial [Polyangiaceae bacterium]|nr:WD40 repeat domain-containing serine/threonine protein kinase [Polyangiaceae bacterium]
MVGTGDPRNRLSGAPLLTSPSADEPDDASATWTVEPLRPLPEHTLVSPGSRADPVEPRNAVLADEIDPLALTLLQEGTPQSVVRTGDHGAPTDVDARNSPATADAYPASRSRLEVTEEHLGRYRMIDDESRRELGRGGIGRVFAAFDRHLNREVAIKELLSESGGGTSAPGSPAMTRFLREARVTGQLEHPNIIPVYELGRRADGTLYYAMRIVRGRTLAGAIADAGDLDERLALVNHFSGLCQAIAYAHSRGVVHRDVKPENVMIGEFGETIVLDWGTAKLRGYCDDKVSASTIRKAEDPSLGETVEGSLFGTPIYMSPEQALGRVSEVDERSDVWALGVVLYTILARQAPFGGRTFVEVRKQLEKGSFRPLSQVDRRIPPELAAIVKRALRVSPGQRYETAREMARDVQAYQAGGRVGAYEYTSLELLKRFLARQRAAVICSLVGLVAVIVLAAATYQRVVAARDRALLAERRALDNEQSAGASAKAARRSLSEMLVEKAALAQADGDVVAAELLAGHALDLGERPDARGIVLAAGASMRPMPVGHLIEASGCDHYAMASRVPLLVCAKHRSVRAWNMGERKAIWDNEEGLAPVTALAISADGQRLLTASAVGVRFHASPFAGPTIVVERRIGRVSAIALSADGKLAAAGTSYGAVVVWDTQNAGGERRYGLGQAISALLFGPRGELVAGGELGAVSVWNPEKDHELKMKGH